MLYKTMMITNKSDSVKLELGRFQVGIVCHNNQNAVIKYLENVKVTQDSAAQVAA